MDDQVTGIDLITAERQRQQDQEGRTAKHDDTHVDGELGAAAACYAMPAQARQLRAAEASGCIGSVLHALWPWGMERWERVADAPASDPVQARIQDLTKAGALAAAEIDRLLRSQRRVR